MHSKALTWPHMLVLWNPPRGHVQSGYRLIVILSHQKVKLKVAQTQLSAVLLNKKLELGWIVNFRFQLVLFHFDLKKKNWNERVLVILVNLSGILVFLQQFPGLMLNPVVELQHS